MILQKRRVVAGNVNQELVESNLGNVKKSLIF